MDARERAVIIDDTAIKNKISAKAIVTEATYVLIGAALGRAQLPFGAFPFGFSALCARGGHAISVFAGLCISLIGRQTPLIYLAAYALTLLIRALSSGLSESGTRERGILSGLFCEHISMRAVAAAVGAFGVGLYRLVVSGFLYYDLFGAIIAIVVSAISAALMYPLEKRSGGELAYNVALAVLLCGVTWGVRDIGFYGISLSVFFAMFASLAVTRKRGAIAGAFIALATGLCVSLSYAPLFVFGAVVYSFLSLVSPFFGAVASFLIGMAWGIYIDGISAVSALLPALLAANFIFLTVDRLYFKDKTVSLAKDEQKNDTDTLRVDEVSVARFDDAASRIKLLCQGFSELSDMLMESDSEQLAEDLAFEVGEMSADTDSVALPYYSAHLADTVRSDSLAAYFRAMSDYLAGVMVENGQRYFEDTDMSERIERAVKKDFPDLDIRVSVLGEDRKRIVMRTADEGILKRKRRELSLAVGRACGFPVRCGDISELDGKFSMIFTRDAILEASFAGRKKCSVHETEFCGDSFGVIADAERSFAFINDGMGSGREAAQTSELCVAFLTKLLPINNFAGDCVEPTLKALNSFLCSRNGAGARECAATVDLCSLDLVDCRAVFYKSGAAPTYIFREGSLFKVRSRTAPIGILREPDIGRVNMELLPGDVIVMVSDGVTQGREDCPDLFEFLRSRIITHDSDQLADAIMQYAESRGCTDDVSVLVIKISEKMWFGAEK